MSDVVFPVLPGLSWSVSKAPVWKTLTQQTVSGLELRAAMMSYPLWRFMLTYDVLRGDNINQELQTLMGFFLARQGSYDTFLYSDPTDNTVTTQTFGTGDGTTTAFQLLRGVGGYLEPIQNVNGNPSVYVDGVLQAGSYTIGSTGIVSFTGAPPAGALLTWTGSFYFRARFMQDTAEFEEFMQDLWRLKKLQFQSVKL
ncbi:MAG: DUF2460 domain-containing protein [Betaproteobacteria bacterium]|nr:DUF2460 domain-containing protein [Betaproteobacteria bacterium]